MNREKFKSRSLTRERNYASQSHEAAASTTGKGLAEVPAFYATIFLIFCSFPLLLSLSLLLLHQYNHKLRSSALAFPSVMGSLWENLLYYDTAFISS